MIEKCINWIKESARRADDYYRAMTVWVTSRRKIGSVTGLVRLASAYERGLDKALACLRKLRPSKGVDAQITTTETYKALISDDIRLLRNLKE